MGSGVLVGIVVGVGGVVDVGRAVAVEAGVFVGTAGMLVSVGEDMSRHYWELDRTVRGERSLLRPERQSPT